MLSCKKNLVRISGTFLYIGRIPGPGGTIGSLVVYGPAFLMVYSGVHEPLFTCIWACVCSVSALLSVFVGRNALGVFGKTDPNEVVIDEIAGASLSLLLYPSAFSGPGIVSLFLLFRFFDILKPFGIRKLEHVGGGLGIVLDDLAAGFFPLVIIQISRFIFKA